MAAPFSRRQPSGSPGIVSTKAFPSPWISYSIMTFSFELFPPPAPLHPSFMDFSLSSAFAKFSVGLSKSHGQDSTIQLADGLWGHHSLSPGHNRALDSPCSRNEGLLDSHQCPFSPLIVSQNILLIHKAFAEHSLSLWPGRCWYCCGCY